MLTGPLLDFVRTNAPIEGNFHVGFPYCHKDIVNNKSLVINELDGRIIVRDYLIDNIIKPLIEASVEVSFHMTEFNEKSFNGEGANLQKILQRKQRNDFKLVSKDDCIDPFRTFWGGFDFDHDGRRGYILFIVDDGAMLAWNTLFSVCYDPGVMDLGSLRAAAGRSFMKKIVSYVALHPTSTAILLGDSGSLNSMTVFPGEAVFAQRLDEAISSACDFIHQ